MSAIRSQGLTPSFFCAGGALHQGAGCYVERAADKELYAKLSQGEFCYVLTSRQMGKSSLMVRTAARLREGGCRVLLVDLAAIGSNVTPDQRYAGFLEKIGCALDLDAQLEDYCNRRHHLSPVQRFVGALREVILPDVHAKVPSKAGPALVIFVDEIDTVRSLPFPTDEFFRAILECYQSRVIEPTLSRLTFCLLGVATPAELTRDPRSTPFNIGYRIDLEDFTPDEAAPLVQGLQSAGDHEKRGRGLLDRVLYWTSGHPYLTQCLCQAITGKPSGSKQGNMRQPSGSPGGPEASEALVDALCEDRFLSPRGRDRDDNLLFVRERLLRTGADVVDVLDAYHKVLEGQAVRWVSGQPILETLCLAGVVKLEEDLLAVRNRIYATTYNVDWIKANKPEALVEMPDGRWLPVGEKLTIGRSSASEAQLDSGRVSRRHAQVQRHRGGQFWLVDLNSRNGTFLNGERVVGPAALHDRDEIVIENHRLRFRLSHPADFAIPESLTSSNTSLSPVR